MKHLAVIMDGNGRFAERQRRPRSEGHVAGAEAFVRLTEDFVSLPLSVLTVYAFSTENKKRSEREVGALFDIIGTYLEDKIYPIAEQGRMSVAFIGNNDLLPPFLCKITEKAPRFPDGKMLLIALSYGGDDEIVRAARAVLRDGEELSSKNLKSHLDTYPYPDPEAVLRYGGYQRLSNFLPLQTAYSELFFTEKLWPEYARNDIIDVLEKYKTIKRNFGE